MQYIKSNLRKEIKSITILLQEQTHKHATSTYLIDQIDPPPEYASQTPSSQPSSAAYDPHEDDYAEVLRRNAYNHQLGKLSSSY